LTFPSLAVTQQSADHGSPDSTDVYGELAKLASDFAFSARQSGRIIIMEHGLPNEQKTIKPKNTGGMAGGVKYIVNDILFKFADNGLGIYGQGAAGKENAGKATNLDLLGCASVFGARLPGIRVPLMALIDFRGQRLSAQSVLPIGINTLAVGSSDGCTTVHWEPYEMHERLYPLGRALNLKPHVIRDGKGTPFEMWGPFDLEAHVQHNDRKDRVFLLDFSRLCPPELPRVWQHAQTAGNPAMYQLLRPELVRSNPVPLNSDTFCSAAPDEDRPVHMREVYEASQRLYRFVIPSYAQWLVLQDPASYPAEFSFSGTMHKNGINMRHLFRVLVAVAALHPNLIDTAAPLESLAVFATSPDADAGNQQRHHRHHHHDKRVRAWIHLLLIEMVSRAIKTCVRTEMQESDAKSHHGDDREPHPDLVARYLNNFLRGGNATDVSSTVGAGDPGWWYTQQLQQERIAGLKNWALLIPELTRKFQFCLASEQTLRDTNASSVLQASDLDISNSVLEPSTAGKDFVDAHAFLYLPPSLLVSKSGVSGADAILDTGAWSLRRSLAKLFDPQVLYDSLDRRALFLRLQQVLQLTLRTEAWRERCSKNPLSCLFRILKF
jgi:hypothetical protein